jgi:Na+-translocating ferredoxin:NAD+ oxidoreductase RnfG subunit
MASFHPPALVSKTLIALTLATAPVSAATISGLATLLTLSEASAATVYWELPALLTSFFPGADRVSFAKVALSQQERAALSRKLGRPLRSDWTIFIATKAGQVTGYAVVDEVRGMHEPITYATRFTPAGAISRMEVMRYREAYGGEVREQRFLSQFNGKTAASPMRAGSDITAISGATISSYAVTRGAEETAALLGLLLQQRPSALLHAAK